MSDTLASTGQLRLRAQLEARDSLAFCELYDTNVSYVYKLARCLADDPAWAECVTEEVFSSVWRSPAALDPAHGSVRQALSSLVESLALSHAMAPCAEADAAQRVRVALHTMPVSERRSLDAVYFGGQTMSAAAAALGTSVIDVARDLRAGLRALNDARIPAQPGAGQSAVLRSLPRSKPAPDVA